MDPDLALSLGLVVSAFSIPSILSALSDRRAPRASAVTVLIGGALVLYALQTKPGGYDVSQVPDIFVSVVGRYMP
ncbi:MAG: hypothetical protein ABJL67_06100 [Sulfitobacter sp.]